MPNYIYDENNNLILENSENYMVGDVIVINGKNEYEVTFVDANNNLAYAEYNGSYNNKTFTSRYKANIIVFSSFFIVFLLFVFCSALFYKLKLKRQKKHSPKRH